MRSIAGKACRNLLVTWNEPHLSRVRLTFNRSQI